MGYMLCKEDGIVKKEIKTELYIIYIELYIIYIYIIYNTRGRARAPYVQLV